MAHRNWIRKQKLKDVPGTEEAYQRYVEKGTNKPLGKLGNRFDFSKESPQANPDLLTESQGMYADSQMSDAQRIMGDAIEHLQGRQRDVYMLTMRQGMSLREAAALLGIAKGTAQVYKDRAIKFITDFCRQKLED